MLSTHVLDMAVGRPAAGIVVALARIDGNEAIPVAAAVTNRDGRTNAPLARNLVVGIYALTFAVAPYFARVGVEAFYDTIEVRILVADVKRNYHVPLLLSPWGYSTYRGS